MGGADNGARDVDGYVVGVGGGIVDVDGGTGIDSTTRCEGESLALDGGDGRVVT